jgi:hypothetical protein
MLKNRAEGRDPALCGFCKCSPIHLHAALSKTPHAWADGLMLVLQHPAEAKSKLSDQRSESDRRSGAGAASCRDADAYGATNRTHRGLPFLPVIR